MSTRSVIAGKLSDGSIKAIYVHHDGYGHLPILRKNYNSQDMVDKLIALGCLSDLDETIELCNAYCRDKGESYENNAPTPLDSFEKIKVLNWDQEYYYTWDGSEWNGYKWNRWSGKAEKQLAFIEEKF